MAAAPAPRPLQESPGQRSSPPPPYPPPDHAAVGAADAVRIIDLRPGMMAFDVVVCAGGGGGGGAGATSSCVK